MGGFLDGWKFDGQTVLKVIGGFGGFAVTLGLLFQRVRDGLGAFGGALDLCRVEPALVDQLVDEEQRHSEAHHSQDAQTGRRQQELQCRAQFPISDRMATTPPTTSTAATHHSHGQNSAGMTDTMPSTIAARPPNNSR